MKQLCLLGITLLALGACAPPAAPPPPAPVAAAAYAAGSAGNTTTAFDGHWGPVTVRHTSVGCSDASFQQVLLTIHNGLATAQALGQGITLQGYVTPQGALTMQSSTGQTFQGQINANNVLVGTARGPNCSWDVTWSRAY
jgi:hypothetical protein